MKRLETASDIECVAAAFILHGPLIIGGGAALKPRVEKAFGEDATHVFEDVIGSSKGGRSGRRRDFIKLYDTLLENGDEEPNSSTTCNSLDTRFTDIVEACGQFMQLNNSMMISVRQAPWWRKYLTASLIAATSALLWKLFAFDNPSTSVGTVSPNRTT